MYTPPLSYFEAPGYNRLRFFDKAGGESPQKRCAELSAKHENWPIFSLEVPRLMRSYTTGPWHMLAGVVLDADPGTATAYEIVGPMRPEELKPVPCVYMDLEYITAHNAGRDPDAAQAYVVARVEQRLADMGVEVARVLVMNSDTPRKVSRHAMIYMKGHAFYNALHVGAFMRGVVADEIARGDPGSPMWVRTGPAPAGAAGEFHPYTSGLTSFADMGVYTRARVFRMWGCTKLKKNAPLRIGGLLPHEAGARDDPETFLHTLVCYIPRGTTVRILRMRESDGGDPVGTTVLTIGGPPRPGPRPATGPRPRKPSTHKAPKRRAATRYNFHTAGTAAEFAVVDAVLDHIAAAEKVTLHRERASFCPHYAIFDIPSGSGTCRVRRTLPGKDPPGADHKSDHTSYRVNFERRTWMQRCFSRDCIDALAAARERVAAGAVRPEDAISPEYKFPDDVAARLSAAAAALPVITIDVAKIIEPLAK